MTVVFQLLAFLSTPFLSLEINLWDRGFGATILGANLTSQEHVLQIREAFLDHALIHIPNIFLPPVDLLSFAKSFPHDVDGPRENHYGPIGKAGEERELLLRWKIPEALEVQLQGFGRVRNHYGLEDGDLDVSTKDTREFHADGLHELRKPPIMSCMNSIEVLESGGDTLFIDSRRLYEKLDDDLKTLVHQHRVHYQRQPQIIQKNGIRAYTYDELDNLGNETLHDLLGYYSLLTREENPKVSTVHPLAFSHFFKEDIISITVAAMWIHHLENVVEEFSLSFDESQRFIQNIYESADFKESDIYKHKWNQHDLVCWDNSQVLHSASRAKLYGTGNRLHHRIRLSGPTEPRDLLQEVMLKKRQS